MLRNHIERIVRFPVTTIILALFATAFFAYQFKGLHMVLDPKALLPQDHPYVKLNNEIEKQFGGSRVVLIGVASKDGDIFNPSDIEKIRGINEEVKKIPGILENNVVSIADRKVKYVKAEGDSLEIKSLLEGIEYTPEGMAALKKRVYSNPMFINSLISQDGTVAAIILDFKGGAGDWWQKQSGTNTPAVAAGFSLRNQGGIGRNLKVAATPKQDVVAQFIWQGNREPDKSGNYSGVELISSAWAQEDWKKWQGAGDGVGEKSKVGSQNLEGEGQKSEGSGQESPAISPQEGTSQSPAESQQVEGSRPAKGSGALPSPLTGEGQGGGGQWPTGQEGNRPAGGEAGWPGAQGGEKGWEQWYVSDATIHSNVLKIIDKYKDANTEIYVGGLPIALSFLEADSWRMSRYIYPLALFIIMFVLYFAFRSIQGMVLPIVCALLSVVWAVGLMGVFKIPLDPWNMMTPILILAVAAGHSVQILKRYYEELDVAAGFSLRNQGGHGRNLKVAATPEGEGGSEYWGREASRQAVIDSLTKIGPVMITAGIVAAASFASLLTFKLKTFQSFGLFTAFGILSALVLEMTFIPAARSLMRPPKKVAAGFSLRPTEVAGEGEKSEARSQKLETPSPLTGEGWGGGEAGILNRFLLSISRLVTQRSWLVWIGLLIVIAISFYGINRLTVINSLKGLFFESTQFRKDDAALNKYFGGTATFYVYIEGQERDSLKDPAVLRVIEALQQEIETVPEVGKTQSYVDYVKAMNQSMHGGDKAYRTIPDNKSTISEYLFLFSISGAQGEIDRFLDYQFQKSVVWVFLRDDSTVLGEKLISIVNKSQFPPGIKVGVAGSIPVMMALNQTMVSGKIWNILQIAAIVFIISSIVLRSLVGGILVLLPLAIAVLVNFGVLGIAGIGLGVGTAAISAMAVGFGADYSIYLLYRLREEIRGQDVAADFSLRSNSAVEKTLLTAGKAIIFVALALAAGGVTLLFTGYYLHMEGFLVPLAMLTSSLATLIVLPAVVQLIKPGFIFK